MKTHKSQKKKGNLLALNQVGSKNRLFLGLALFIGGVAIGYFISSAPSEDPLSEIKAKSIAEQREDWIDVADNIRNKLAMEGKYSCCLKKPCWYCIQKTPGHGEGAECTCLQDVLEGRNPCGECIGEIMEGHGLDELKPYYDESIGYKVGTENQGCLQKIIDDMYPEAQ